MLWVETSRNHYTNECNGNTLKVWRCSIANNGRSGWSWSVNDGPQQYCRTLRQAKKLAVESVT